MSVWHTVCGWFHTALFDLEVKKMSKGTVPSLLCLRVCMCVCADRMIVVVIIMSCAQFCIHFVTQCSFFIQLFIKNARNDSGRRIKRRKKNRRHYFFIALQQQQQQQINHTNVLHFYCISCVCTNIHSSHLGCIKSINLYLYNLYTVSSRTFFFSLSHLNPCLHCAFTYTKCYF